MEEQIIVQMYGHIVVRRRKYMSFRYLLEESYSSIESIIVKILLDKVLHIRKKLKRMLVMLSTYDNTKKFYCQADVKATFNSQVHE